MSKSRRRNTSLAVLGLLLTGLFLVNCSRSEDGVIPSEIVPSILNESVPLAAGREQVNSDVLQTAISTSVDAIVNGINLRRTQQGLTPWVMDPALVDLAYERSVDMAVHDYLDHVAPGGAQVLAETGLGDRGFSGRGAELILGSDTLLEEVASTTLEIWFDDIDHRAILLSPDFRFAGVGMMGDGEQWIVTLICAQTRP